MVPDLVHRRYYCRSAVDITGLGVVDITADVSSVGGGMDTSDKLTLLHAINGGEPFIAWQVRGPVSKRQVRDRRLWP